MDHKAKPEVTTLQREYVALFGHFPKNLELIRFSNHYKELKRQRRLSMHASARQESEDDLPLSHLSATVASSSSTSSNTQAMQIIGDLPVTSHSAVMAPSSASASQTSLASVKTMSVSSRSDPEDVVPTEAMQINDDLHVANCSAVVASSAASTLQSSLANVDTICVSSRSDQLNVASCVAWAKPSFVVGSVAPIANHSTVAASSSFTSAHTEAMEINDDLPIASHSAVAAASSASTPESSLTNTVCVSSRSDPEAVASCVVQSTASFIVESVAPVAHHSAGLALSSASTSQSSLASIDAMSASSLSDSEDVESCVVRSTPSFIIESVAPPLQPPCLEQRIAASSCRWWQREDAVLKATKRYSGDQRLFVRKGKHHYQHVEPDARSSIGLRCGLMVRASVLLGSTPSCTSSSVGGDDDAPLPSDAELDASSSSSTEESNESSDEEKSIDDPGEIVDAREAQLLGEFFPWLRQGGRLDVNEVLGGA